MDSFQNRWKLFPKDFKKEGVSKTVQRALFNSKNTLCSDVEVVGLATEGVEGRIDLLFSEKVGDCSFREGQ